MEQIRWRCREDYCERGSFTEFIEQVPARARTTGRLRIQIGGAIGDAARSVAEAATVHGVSWPTAHRAFVAHAKALLAEPEPTRVLGIDETRRGKPRWTRCERTRRWVRVVDPWDTGFVDLAGSQGLLGQREGRTGAAVIDWLRERTPQFRDVIEFVWPSTPPRCTPRRSARQACYPTRRSWSITSTSSSSATTR